MNISRTEPEFSMKQKMLNLCFKDYIFGYHFLTIYILMISYNGVRKKHATY